MAVVSAAPAVPRQIERLAPHDVGTSGSTESRDIEENAPQVVDDTLFVAVGRDPKESKSILLWAVQNCRGRKICILHVHQPAQMIPFMGGKMLASKVKEQEVQAYREVDKQIMLKKLNSYMLFCSRVGVQAEKLDIERDNIEKGIVELVAEHGSKNLVMGAAADRQYSKRMKEPKSKKANFVLQHAHLSCRIWFVCRNHLIYTRESSLNATATEVIPVSQLVSPCTGSSQSSQWRSRSDVRHPKPDEDFRRTVSVPLDVHGGRLIATPSSEGTRGLPTPQSQSGIEGIDNEWKRKSTSSSSHDPARLTLASSEVADTSGLIIEVEYEMNEKGSSLSDDMNGDPQISASPSELEFVRENDELYDQIEQAMTEAANSKREAFEEWIRRRRAEKYAIDAIRKARAAESLCNEEMEKRKETENALAREKQELDKMKNQRDEVIEELQKTQDKKLELESLIVDSERTKKELEEKIDSDVELLIAIKKERDELQVERDSALKEAEELRKSMEEEAASIHRLQFFCEFSFLEIEEATQHFDPSLKIGEGGYGSVYKGFIRHTPVAIKMLNSCSRQGCSEFQMEVDILSRVRHPNLVTLIGACPEAWALIYEYLPCGSLEDRLICKNNTPPLSWQTRTRIATEMCSALIVLHSNKPHNIVHGDLKPANILLDANLMSKLGDFGICRFIFQDEFLNNTSTPCHNTDPKGTFVYMDPEFLATGELTLKSDVYSFGVILLRLLTGRPALGLVKDVQYAVDKGNLHSILDASAGKWPYIQARRLAQLALRCCQMNRKNRPDLATEVWRELEPMRVSCGASSSFKHGSLEHSHIRSHFKCPLFRK